MRGAILLIAIVMGGMVLAGCVSGRPESNTYTDKNGVVQAVESDQELCTRSCNNDYSRCGDSDASRRSIDSTQRMFGASAGCSSSLSSCLSRCKGR